MKREIKPHHLALVAACTIVIFILSFEIGKFVHFRSAIVVPLYHAAGMGGVQRQS